MSNHLLTVAALVTCAALSGQNTAALPPAFETLPGNAGVAMPLRWSKGKMQVFIDPPMMPSNFVGETITGLRLRRSALEGSPAYPAMTRTMQIHGGFQPFPATQMIGSASQNLTIVPRLLLFGPAVVNATATTAPGGPTMTVGEEFVQITFTQPLPVTAGTLFLEFETLDGPLAIAPGNWVDAVQFEGGSDDGYVAMVGDGSCTTRSEPTELRYTSAAGPISATTIDLEVTGAPPTTGTEVGLVLVWLGLDPLTAPPGPNYLGYGASFGIADPLMVDCHQWAPLDYAWSGQTDSAGRFATTLAIPGNAAIGQRLALQAGWLDTSRPVVPLSLSNGLQMVCNSVGVEDHCSTFFFPDDLDDSPWGPQVGLMPVILLDY